MYKVDASTLRREAPAAGAISLSAHVDAHTIATVSGDFFQMFELEGVAHETASIAEVRQWHEQLAGFARNIAGIYFALWSHVVRSPLDSYPGGEFSPGYASELNDRYRRHAQRRGQYGTRIYLTVLYRPNPTMLGRVGSRMDRLSQEALQAEVDAACERLDGIERDVLKFLGRWGPRRLGVVERGGVLFSEPVEFCGYLVNGYHQPMPLRWANLGETLMTARPLFGRETFELRGPESSVFGAALEFKEFPDTVQPGCMDELLRINAPIVLAQSFAYLERTAARGAIQRQANRLESTGDEALSQQVDLEDAKDDLISGRYAMGDHHVTLIVKAQTLDALPAVIAEARQAMSAGGGVVSRATIELEPAFWSQLPGAFGKRPRPGMLGTRHWAALNAMHSFPTGQATGNHWGPAVAMFRTANGSPYFFSFHRSDVGHFCLLGSTGAGKTVQTLFLVAMLTRLGTQVTYFDKDSGAEIAIKAMGGNYFALRPGVASGFAPFCLPATQENIAAVQRLMRAILRNGEAPHTAREMSEIDEAVRQTFRLKRMAHMMSFLEPPEGNNLAERLKRWVVTSEGRGPLAWVFDNERDTLDLSSARINGIDMTYFLEDPEIRTPAMMYLCHRIDQLKDGRRVATFIDEGWKALDDPMLESLVADWYKTDRKREALLGLITQSPSDALKSRAARTIVEQTPTKIFLPNNQASRAEYIEGFGMTPGEFAAFSELTEGSRRFLVKQGSNSVICELDLTELEEDLSVLSGKSKTVRLQRAICKAHGDDPAVWLPIFLEEQGKL